MKNLQILGDNRFETYTKTRRASRGIVLKGERLLLSWEERADLWMIPGGGLEQGETPEACCVREVREETGFLVRPARHILQISEYYEEYRFLTDYFLCEAIGTGRQQLTEEETRRGLTPRWIPLREALRIFGNHAAYAAVSEEKRGLYLREFTALKACAASDLFDAKMLDAMESIPENARS